MSDSTNASAPPPGASSIPSPGARPSVPATSAPPRASFPMAEEALALATELAAALAEGVANEDDKLERAILQHESGEFDERLRADELGAAKQYLAAFNARPVNFRPPLFGLIRLYARRRSMTNLAKLLEAMIKAAPTEREKAESIVQRGELLEDRLEDSAGGRAAYEEASVLDPTCRSAWMALERSGLKDNDPDLVRRALLKLAELTLDQNRKSRLWTEVAWDLSRESTPETLEEASRLLHEAAALPLGRWRALVEMERFSEKNDRPADLVFALEGRAALAQEVVTGQGFQGGSGAFAIARLQDAEEARNTAADLWARAARVRLVSLADTAGAMSAMEQALTLKPDDTRFRVYAMHLCDQAGEIEQAAKHASWLLEREYGDASVRGSLHFRRAEAAASAGDVQAAGEALRQALTVNPESAATLGALIDQMAAAGDGPGVAAEFDRLAVSEETNKKRRASLYRAAAVVSLAIAGDVDGAVRRFRSAADEDPQDVLSRRALVVLLSREARGDNARALVARIEELLPLAADDDERVALLLGKLSLERHELKAYESAAATAESIARALDDDPWALRTAMLLREAHGAHTQAAKLAEELAEKAEGDARRDYSATAIRLAWAAGDENRARNLASTLSKELPEDPYLATLSFRLNLAARDPAAALDVLLRKAESCPDEQAARWLLIGAVLLAAAGAKDESRKALEQAAERVPGSPAVRAALLATTRWRVDTALRTLLAETALDSADAGDEEVALGVELVLAKTFLEHDVPSAMESLDRVVARAGAESLAVAMLNAIVLGSQRGPDAEETVNALQGVLSAMPAQDPLRVAIELEVARALSSSQATRDQAAEVRELLDEEQPHSVAPRLLALLDAIQREERAQVPTALCRVADGADEQTAVALRSVALGALRAQGRDAEARALAMTFPELAASAVTLSELPANLDHAASRAQGIRERTAISAKDHRPGLERRAAVWSSAAGRDEEAIEAVERLVKADPDDVISWDVLRVAGRRQGKWARVVEACVALAERVKTDGRAAELWEEAGVVFLEHLKNEKKAEPALRKALECDPRRVLAYQRMRQILEKRKDNAGLEALVTTRIEASQNKDELADLLWEQARLRRALGRKEEALESANSVVELNPEHVAALALVAEVHATAGRLAEAAQALVQLARAKETPAANRRFARNGAIDIFDVRLKQPASAIEQIDALVAEGDADDKTVQRGLDIATRAELWDSALRFASLAADRAKAPDARSAALLRVAAIHRDKLKDSAAALRAAQAAHEAMPRNLAALEVLHGLADDDERSRRAKRTIDAIREVIRTEGPNPDAVLSVEKAARLGSDLVLARAAQRLARALGADTPVTAVSVPSTKASLRDAGLVLRYRSPDDVGAAVVLFETVMPDMGELVGLTTDDVGVGRSDRHRGAHPVRDALSPYASAAGFPSFELYIGGNDDNRVAVLPGEPISIVLGKRVAPPFDDATRFRLMRALLLTARGLAPFQLIQVRDAAEIVLAALHAADVAITGGTSKFEARLKPVAKALSRRARKAIADSGRQVAGSPDPQGELARGARAALATARRGALALSGAVNHAIADQQSSDPADAARRDLSLFAISDALVTTMRETGVDRG